MFRQIILAVIILFLGNYTLLGQKTDIPLNNFIVNQESKELYYQKIFEIQKDSVASIKKKIERITSTTLGIGNVVFDSNVCSGRIYKVEPPYYGGEKDLEGYFKIEIKNGKCVLTISKMTLHGSTFAEELSSVVLTSSFKHWEQPMASKLLPDIDELYTHIFNIGQGSAGKW